MVSYRISNLVIIFVVFSSALSDDDPCDDLKTLFKGEYRCLDNKEVREEQFGHFYPIQNENSKKKYLLKFSYIDEDHETFDTNILEEAFEKVKSLPYIYHRVDQHEEMPLFYEIFEDFETTELLELIESGKLTSDPYKMFDLFKKIMSGVKAFADAGYIIRDLRPKTILVNAELNPVISGLDYLGRKGEPAKKAYLRDNVAPEMLVMGLNTPNIPEEEKSVEKSPLDTNKDKKRLEIAGNSLSNAMNTEIPGNSSNEDKKIVTRETSPTGDLKVLDKDSNDPKALIIKSATINDLKYEENQVVFSLGLILYHMLFLSPFETKDESTEARIISLKEDRFNVPIGTPVYILNTMLCMTNFDPKLRCTFQELEESIKNIDENELAKKTKKIASLTLSDKYYEEIDYYEFIMNDLFLFGAFFSGICLLFLLICCMLGKKNKKSERTVQIELDTDQNQV